MYNWNVDTSKSNKKSSSYRIWRLEQLINFGLNGEKISLSEIKKYWPKLDLDPARKTFLQRIVWPNQS